MANAAAFFPAALTKTATITGVSSAATAIDQPGNGESLRLFNDSATKTFVAWGISTLADATTADFPLAPNSIETIRIPPTATHLKCIGGTGTLYFTKGEGV